MPALQLKVDGKVLPTEYEDFVKADKAIRALTKAGKLSDTADIRIVPALKAVTAETPASSAPAATEKVVVIRERYVKAPSHNRVMTAAMLIGVGLGWVSCYCTLFWQ